MNQFFQIGLDCLQNWNEPNEKSEEYLTYFMAYIVTVEDFEVF
jgi:hypothetical protein